MSNEKFQYSLHINQRAAVELGIENANQAIVFEYLSKAIIWATPVNINGETYHFVARSLTANQLPLLGLKIDTVYRHYNRLKELGLIDYKKYKGMDCIRVTPKAKKYFFGNKAEMTECLSNENSEKNPSYKKGKIACDENTENVPKKCGIKSDILVKTNTRKTTTTGSSFENITWPNSINENLRSSIIRSSLSKPVNQVQTAIDEVAGRIEAGSAIKNPVGYFKSLLDSMANDTFTSAYAVNIAEKRNKELRNKQNLAMILEQSEKSRIAMIEQHEKRKNR